MGAKTEVVEKEVVVTETEIIETVIIEEVPVYITDTGLVYSDDIWVESFVQPYGNDGVDIVWVIDFSGSMNGDYDRLMAGIEAMMNALPKTNWRLNIISTDASRSVTEEQFPLVPGDTIDDAKALYNSVTGGTREDGFEAIHDYIEENAYASTWMRDDASLLVVFVSDEDDQSMHDMLSLDDFIDWYSIQRETVFLSSIVNLDPADSTCNNSTHNTGERYIDATTYFGGIIVDICSDDWSTGVADATKQVEPYEEWTLNYIPIEDSIRIFYDGVVNSGWVYDSTTNVVDFTGNMPESGVLVEISYLRQ
tara:strand:+ start:1154 stop:2077 length:924 start_codon:yes stop_codon:yes gene_type:complete